MDHCICTNRLTFEEFTTKVASRITSSLQDHDSQAAATKYADPGLAIFLLPAVGVLLVQYYRPTRFFQETFTRTPTAVVLIVAVVGAYVTLLLLIILHDVFQRLHLLLSAKDFWISSISLVMYQVSGRGVGQVSFSIGTGGALALGLTWAWLVNTSYIWRLPNFLLTSDSHPSKMPKIILVCTVYLAPSSQTAPVLRPYTQMYTLRQNKSEKTPTNPWIPPLTTFFMIQNLIRLLDTTAKKGLALAKPTWKDRAWAKRP